MLVALFRSAATAAANIALLLTAVCLGGGTAKAQITDLPDVGNEIAVELNSISNILNHSSGCLTPDQRISLESYLIAVKHQIQKDEKDLWEMAPGRWYKPDRIVSDWDRAMLRLKNYERSRDELEKEIRYMPRCRPNQTRPIFGWYIGGQLIKDFGIVRSIEFAKETGTETNRFTDFADPPGGGLIIGYKFAPWANSVIVSPFASFDFLHAPVNHTFPGGSYLGTTANFIGTFGVKAGPEIGAGVWLYGIVGVSVLNETLNIINFPQGSSSQSAWVAGGTVGLGGAWQPGFLQGFGRPLSLFAEYHHTWWQSANFNTPAASPSFNYNFARQEDVVKFGFTVSLSEPTPAPAPSYPVKALPGK